MKSLLSFASIALLLLSCLTAVAEPFRLGMTSATARGQYALLEAWRLYMQKKLDHPVAFVFQRSNLECMDLMKQKKLDFAWIAAPAYLDHRQQANLLATPLYHGKPLDVSYLIVPAQDRNTRSLTDLQGRVVAFVDPDSSTGYLDAIYQLRVKHQDPVLFFKKTFFTFDDQKIVAAVAIGLADAGVMSGVVWDTLQQARPDITSQTRLVSRSAGYGTAPFIVRSTLDKHSARAMQQVLLAMSGDAEGEKLLGRLNMDGFLPADPKLYRSVFLMMQGVNKP